MGHGRQFGKAKRDAQQWLSMNAPQQCVVCHKWFVRRADKVCSRDCLEKLEKQQLDAAMLAAK